MGCWGRDPNEINEIKQFTPLSKKNIRKKNKFSLVAGVGFSIIGTQMPYYPAVDDGARWSVTISCLVLVCTNNIGSTHWKVPTPSDPNPRITAICKDGAKEWCFLLL